MVEETMTPLNWDYIKDILNQATAGGTGCSPELFDGWKAQQALDSHEGALLGASGSRLDAGERQKFEEELARFHRHSSILYDLGFIEIWDPQEISRRWVMLGAWSDGDEFWPKRVTASGYMFLENTQSSSDGRWRRLLEKGGVRAARMLGQEMIEQVISRFPGIAG